MSALFRLVQNPRNGLFRAVWYCNVFENGQVFKKRIRKSLKTNSRRIAEVKALEMFMQSARSHMEASVDRFVALPNDGILHELFQHAQKYFQAHPLEKYASHNSATINLIEPAKANTLPAVENSTTVTLDGLFNEYLSWARINKRFKTIEAETTSMNHLKAFTKNTIPASKQVQQYILHRTQKVKKVSVNIEIRSLKSVFNHMIKLGLIQNNPFRNVKALKVPPTTKRALSDEETEMLLSASVQAGRNASLFIHLGLLAGLRKSEILNSQWAWFDFEKHVVTPAVNMFSLMGVVYSTRSYTDDFVWRDVSFL